MKNRITWTFFCFCFIANLMYSQTRKGVLTRESTEAECKHYFNENITLLDPIEGYYESNITMNMSNSYRREPPTTDSECFAIYKVAEGQYKSTGPNFTILRIGETNAYNIYMRMKDIGHEEKKRFYLQNNTRFKVLFTIPDKVVQQELGSRWNVTMTYDLIKAYPTYSMYQQAQIERKNATSSASWTGTGFPINDEYVVTNFHVVDGADHIYVQGVSNLFSEKVLAKVAAVDRINDLALLKLEPGDYTKLKSIPYRIKTKTSDVGEDIFVLGYPLTSTMGEEVKLSTGVINSKSGFKGNISMYQISAPVQHGNSGAPMFDDRDNIIGVVNVKHLGAENVNYAVKSSFLNNLIETQEIKEVYVNKGIAGMSLVNKVKLLTNYTFLISCKKAIPNSSKAIKKRTYNTGSTVGKSYAKPQNVIYIDPYVEKKTKKRSWINKVVLSQDYTMVELTINNTSFWGYYSWVSLSPNTYIIPDSGSRQILNKAFGIKIAPEKTYFYHNNQNLTFELYFKPIPQKTKKFDLIENVNKGWKFYGVELYGEDD